MVEGFEHTGIEHTHVIFKNSDRSENENEKMVMRQ